MPRVVGVGIGERGLQAGALDANGEIESIERLDLPDLSVGRVVPKLVEFLGQFGPLRRVGVGVAGLVRDGIVLESPNFSDWRDVPLGAVLKEQLGVPVTVENDGNCAAFGLWQERGAQGELVLLTLGTGVGGGVITEGRLLRGCGGTGAELGHVYVGGDRDCSCGGRGCLETWCSAQGLRAAAIEKGIAVNNGHDVARRAAQGESWALRVCDAAADALGRGLVSLVNTLNPNVIVVACDLVDGRKRFAHRSESILRRRAIQASVERVRLVWTDRTDALTIAGAAALAGEQG